MDVDGRMVQSTRAGHQENPDTGGAKSISGGA